MRQNWNNILSYIKTHLGATLNFIELSDEDIVDYIKEHTLYEFSQYVPLKKQCIISEKDKLPEEKGQLKGRYKIPVKDDEVIIDILNVYYSSKTGRSGSSSWDDPFYDTKFADDSSSQNQSYFGMIDSAINNVYSDIQSHMRAKNTWEFFNPDILQFDFEIDIATVVYNIPHVSPATIRPDLYNSAFKKLCLGQIQKILSSVRSKYSEISTPFGPIRLDYQELKSDAQMNIDQAMEILKTVPLDHIIHML